MSARTKSSPSTAPEVDDDPTVNLAVLRGVASAPAEIRVLPSGQRLATLAVRVHSLGPAATSVPVAWWDPPGWVETVDVDDPLVVVGALRRRFYRPGVGGVGSRVEVEARMVGRGRDRRRLDAALRLADDALTGLA
jgi:hypothetical protein